MNQIFIALFSLRTYSFLKAGITSSLPLQEYLIYNLPEGLWVFCITVTSSFFYLEYRNRKWGLVYVPILVAVIMEIFQLLHFANGRFDMMDIIFATGFWLLALFCTNDNAGKEPLFQPVNIRTLCCFASYFIVYLAHVTY